MAGPTTLKQYLALVKEFFTEDRRGAQRSNTVDRRAEDRPTTFPVVLGSKFNDSLVKHERVFSDLRDKLKKFIDTKQTDPLRSRYGKHDAPFAPGTPLAGYMHCHLRDDAILIYTLKNRQINLVMIVSHAEIDGNKSATKTAKALMM